jgi:hypothetical protein
MSDNEYGRLLERVRTLADLPIDNLRQLHGDADESIYQTRQQLRGVSRGDLIVYIIQSEFEN